jgi:hypothetical protein
VQLRLFGKVLFVELERPRVRDAGMLRHPRIREARRAIGERFAHPRVQRILGLEVESRR